MNQHKSQRRRPFLVRFAYCSKEFFGVQEQRERKTVLGALRERIECAAGQETRALVVTARTDKNVSALVNFASFYLRPPIDVDAVISLATTARDDGLIAIDMKIADVKTHARSVVSSKAYRYTIKDNCTLNEAEDESGFVWFIVPSLSIHAMRVASNDFVGEQDFSSVRGGGCEAGSSIKRVTAVDIYRNSAGYIIIEIQGHGFLRKMVRNIVGLLAEIGSNLRSCDAVSPILAQKNRRAAGIMAPAHGLMLFEMK